MSGPQPDGAPPADAPAELPLRANTPAAFNALMNLVGGGAQMLIFHASLDAMQFARNEIDILRAEMQHDKSPHSQYKDGYQSGLKDLDNKLAQKIQHARASMVGATRDARAAAEATPSDQPPPPPDTASPAPDTPALIVRPSAR